MADNRSLDEFVGAEESGEAADDGSAEPATGAVDPTSEASHESQDDLDVEPMAETFAWSATGGECATCGETVEERWRDGDTLVCPDCKAW